MAGSLIGSWESGTGDGECEKFEGEGESFRNVEGFRDVRQSGLGGSNRHSLS